MLAKHFYTLNQKLKTGELFTDQIDLVKHRISRTELLGTIIHAGFAIVQETGQSIVKLVFKKTGPPGPLEEIRRAKHFIFRQPRVGLGGKIIHVLKVRTMYPLAHLAQDYLLKQSGRTPYGKPIDEYRVTPLGRILRKYWLDELPQFINILKGEMKLVGVRPLDEAFFKTLPSALQTERLKHLPALMATVYADRPQTLTQRFESELKYLRAHSQHPFLTDLKYFFKILWSILFRGQRGE